MLYPPSHLCKSVKDGQLGFWLAVSHEVGTINSRADRNEQDNKSESYQGYQNKMVHKTKENIQQIRGP
jgi:hypothetical protein